MPKSIGHLDFQIFEGEKKKLNIAAASIIVHACWSTLKLKLDNLYMYTSNAPKEEIIQYYAGPS
jgi:hypothetical protein